MIPFDSNHDYISEFIETWNRRVRRTKTLMIALGALLVLAGIAIAVAPLALFDTIQLIAAVVLIAHGIAQVASYMQTPEFFRSPAVLLTGILNALLGVLLIALPSYLTAGTIVFLLAFLFIATGIERISFARQLRFFGTGGSSMGTVTGVLNIVLGVLFLFMPMLSSMMIGYMMAAYLVVAGATLVVEGFSIKRIER